MQNSSSHETTSLAKQLVEDVQKTHHLRSNHIYTKDASYCAEPDENSIFIFLFVDVWLTVLTIFKRVVSISKCIANQNKIRSKVAKFTGDT